MRLPNEVEQEIRAIEADYASRGGQQAGTPRLRGLRGAIETFYGRELAALKAENEKLIESLAWANERERKATVNADAAIAMSIEDTGPIRQAVGGTPRGDT